MVVTNMRVLKKSRKRARPGDVFALQVEEGRFLFGRVMRLEARIGFFDFQSQTTQFWNCVLIYIYTATSSDKHNTPELNKERLLVPPMMTNLLPWSKGYFETVEHRPLRQEDSLPVHCFWDAFCQCYYDDNGNRLPGRSEPCGVYALKSYRTIDDAVSEALGIPLAPEDEHVPNVLEGGMTIAMSATDLAERGITGRDRIEDALDKALSACKLGEVTGGGRSVNHANIEVLAADETKVSEALAVVKSTLRDLRLPKSTRIYLPGEQVHNLYD